MLAAHLTLLLVRELETFQREIALYPDDDSVWKTLPGVANSAGNLAMHVAGNLQHFVGAVLGKTGYVRQRDLEFSRRSGTREEVSLELQRAIDAVKRSLPNLSMTVLESDYPEAVGGVTITTSLFLTHLASHAAFHLGQAGYLRRALTGDATTAGTLPLKPLARG